MEWSDVYAPTCEGCKQLHGERVPPEEPPCDTCRPKYFAENADAIKIFFLIRNQLIIGNEIAIDINHQAIHEAMKLYEVENRKACFEKVLTLCASRIERLNENAP